MLIEFHRHKKGKRASFFLYLNVFAGGCNSKVSIAVQDPTPKKITFLEGKKLDNTHFNIEDVSAIDEIDFGRMKNEKVIGFKIRGYLPQEARETIRQNFVNSPYRYNRQDLDNHQYVGAYLARIPLEDYFLNAYEKNQHLPSMFHNTENAMDDILEKLRVYFEKQGIVFRKAKHHDKPIAPYNLHNWIRNARSSERNLSLVVHDDLSLVMDNRFEGFEIQNVKSTFAINLCVQNSNSSGGKLAFWNILPSIEYIKSFNSTFDYGPYDAVDLSEFDYREVKIESGDLYLFNGQFLHAVTDLKNNGDMRLGFSLFCGYIDDNTIIYWE